MPPDARRHSRTDMVSDFWVERYPKHAPQGVGHWPQLEEVSFSIDLIYIWAWANDLIPPLLKSSLQNYVGLRTKNA